MVNSMVNSMDMVDRSDKADSNMVLQMETTIPRPEREQHHKSLFFSIAQAQRNAG